MIQTINAISTNIALCKYGGCMKYGRNGFYVWVRIWYAEVDNMNINNFSDTDYRRDVSLNVQVSTYTSECKCKNL